MPVVDLGLPARGLLRRNGLNVALIAKLRELRLDAIHLHHFVAHNKLSLAAKIAGIPRIVVTEHSEADLLASIAGRMRLRANWRLADRIVVIHDGLQEYLAGQLGISRSRISVVPNGIDSNHWNRNDRAARRTSLGLDGAFVFVYVGRLAPIKNVPQLILAYLEAQRRSTSAMRLIVVGDGVAMEECRRIVGADPGGGTVVFVGEQQNTRPYLAVGDAFVLNSSSEGTPRALLEAMCLGLPAICPAVGGIPKLLGSCGWLTNPSVPETVVAAMLSASGNPGSSHELGKMAHSLVREKYSAASTVDAYRRLLLSPRTSGQ
jgi:glycosyltransferase involved in cell wall biosynthesis